MQKNQFENQTPALLWIDRDIFNNENQIYCQQLEKNYPDSFFTINDEFQFFEVQEQNQDKQLIIISSGECAYNLIQMTYNPIIIFCKNKHYHYDLFIQNQQIKAVVSDQFQDANSLSIQCMNNMENINCFKELISPPQTASSPQYQHSKSNISIKFFVVIEEIRKSTKITEETLKNELINLRAEQIKFQGQFQAKLQVENELFTIAQTEKDKKIKFKLYQKLLILYTSEKLKLYSILNTKFAEYKYQEIKTILHLLFKGFKKMSKKQNYYLTLYRGISLNKKLFDEIVNDFKESKKYQKSLFWNSLVSTSFNIDVAYNFAFNDEYGIIYEIELDPENPHPHLRLEDDLTVFQNEKEILLFPQFEFVVNNIKQTEFGQNHLIIKIRQQKNNHAFILDQRLRNIYWRDIQDKIIYPKVKSIIEFNFLRLDQLFQIMYEQECQKKQIQKYLEQEINNNFTLLQQDLFQIFFNKSNCEVSEQIYQMINLFRKSIQYQNQSDNPYDYIQTFQAYFKKVKKALRTNISTLLLKGIIDLQFCEDILKALREQFQKTKEALNVPTFNTFGQQAKIFQQADLVTLNSAGMTNQQLKAQKITSIQKVQNSKTGNLAYEVTLKDGNRLLMHQNPNNQDMLMFNKQLDSQGKVGYTNKWKPVGQQEKISHLTVEDVQTSIKGKQVKFDYDNVNKLEMNGKMQAARQTGQIGGAIATAAGSLAVDLYYDDFDSKKIGQAVAITAGVQGGFMYMQSIKSMSSAVPFVGIGLTAAMTSIQIGQVVVSDFLKTSEKYYNAVLVTIKTATTVGLGIAGVEGGMMVGAAGGPVGVIIGGIVGGLLGGAGGNLLNRCVDYFTQFQIEIQFSNENKSEIQNGYLIQPGKLPTIKWKNVKAKAKSLLLIAQADDKHICCIIPNIDPKQNQISHEDNLGIKLKGYKYLGPDKSCQEIVFRLYALMDEYVDEKDVLYNFKKNNLKIFDQAIEKIKLVEK